MLTYINTKVTNFIALSVANETNDENIIINRLYNNNVELYYTIDLKHKLIHILYIESKNKKQGNATNVLKAFINEFKKYSIIIDAIYYLRDWYEELGFVFEYEIDEMFAFRMKLYRGDDNEI